MDLLIESKILKGKNYKGVFQYLCEISDVIYLTYDDSFMINEKLYELYEQCERVKVSERIRNRFSKSIMGFKIDIFIKIFIYEHENISQLLGDRGNGCILFCEGQTEMAFFGMDDFGGLYITTDNLNLIQKLSEIRY